MTSLLRFFILALTPLLAVTVSLGPAVLFGLATTAVVTAVAGLMAAVRPHLSETGRMASALGLSVVLVTLLDIAVSNLLPGVRAVWGIYLNLLAFSPLILLPAQQPRSGGAEVAASLRMGLWLTLLFLVAGAVREALGLGTLTLLPESPLVLPWLKENPLTIVATGAGGFFLAAAVIVAYRALRPHLPETALAEFKETEPEPSPAEELPELPGVPKTVEEARSDWGEDVSHVVASLASFTGKRRLLVIGSGNGEQAYHLSMLCLEASRTTPFDFRVRGVDHFAARIEAAARGVYREHQVEFIPARLRDAWMTRGQGDDRLLRVNNDPRLHVQFEVADFQQGPLFYPQPCHVIVLNQGIEFVSEEKKKTLLRTVCDQILPGGALIVSADFRRELLPEGMKRTGPTVFRKG